MYKISITAPNIKEYPLHYHQNAEIMLYTKGSGILKCELGDIPFSKDTVIIVPQGISHGSKSDAPFENISISGDISVPPHLDKVISLTASPCSIALAKLIYENRLKSEALVSALVNSYLLSLQDNFSPATPLEKTLENILAEINRKATDYRTNVSDIMSKYGYALDYIRNEFSKKYHIRPTEYLNKVRIEHAKQLCEIYRYEYSITQIALKCGYNNVQYFSKQFRKYTGVSPIKYKTN